MNEKMNVRSETKQSGKNRDAAGARTFLSASSVESTLGLSRDGVAPGTAGGGQECPRSGKGMRALLTLAGAGALGLVLLALAAVAGCTTQPSALERRLYAIETNPFPVSVTAVPGSNGVEYVTNYAPAYAFRPSPAVQQALAIGGMFGTAREIAGASYAMLQRYGLEAAGLRRFVAGGNAFARESGGNSVAGHYAGLGNR